MAFPKPSTVRSAALRKDALSFAWNNSAGMLAYSIERHCMRNYTDAQTAAVPLQRDYQVASEGIPRVRHSIWARHCARARMRDGTHKFQPLVSAPNVSRIGHCMDV